jgi:hypothetical protein
VAYLKYYASICLEGLRNTMNHFGQNIRCPSRHSNRAPTEYKSRALLVDNCIVQDISVVKKRWPVFITSNIEGEGNTEWKVIS